jgi:hypothetical protein
MIKLLSHAKKIYQKGKKKKQGIHLTKTKYLFPGHMAQVQRRRVSSRTWLMLSLECAILGHPSVVVTNLLGANLPFLKHLSVVGTNLLGNYLNPYSLHANIHM